MGEPTDREAALSAAADYVRRLKERLAEGQREIARQKAAVSETREHIDEVTRWRAESDRLLAEFEAELDARNNDSARRR